MSLNYPNGVPFIHNEGNSKKKQEKKKPQFGKRGMDFETEINQTNHYYLVNNQAVIHKKPTPVQIVSVDYPKRSAAVIKEAYFKQPSTTDYNGIYKGYYLDFEAKETKNKTSFPLKNFHEHQITHMNQCTDHGGIAFVLLWFSSLNRCFFLSANELSTFWQSQNENGRKSIPIATIEKIGIEISFSINPKIHYLKAVEQYIQSQFDKGVSPNGK